EPVLDRRPRLLVCGVDASNGLISDVFDQGWQPEDAVAVDLGDVSTDDEGLQAISDGLVDNDCVAVLLIGSDDHEESFRVQMRAENRRGGSGRDARILKDGPAVARATAPVAEVVRALREAGMQA